MDRARPLRQAITSHPRRWHDFHSCYPVISKRSKGLSVGINLNPDGACNFDCIYCCVDRSRPAAIGKVDLAALENELHQLVNAAKSDLFIAFRVPVDVESKTAALARDLALVQGQRRGLTMVLRRLTVRRDHSRLPVPSAAELDRLIDGVLVENEKSSPTRYLAELIVEYKRDEIRRLLTAAGIRHSETRAQPTLVLPVFEDASGRMLFEEENAWLAAWVMTEGSSRLANEGLK